MTTAAEAPHGGEPVGDRRADDDLQSATAAPSKARLVACRPPHRAAISKIARRCRDLVSSLRFQAVVATVLMIAGVVFATTVSLFNQRQLLDYAGKRGPAAPARSVSDGELVTARIARRAKDSQEGAPRETRLLGLDCRTGVWVRLPTAWAALRRRVRRGIPRICADPARRRFPLRGGIAFPRRTTLRSRFRWLR